MCVFSRHFTEKIVIKVQIFFNLFVSCGNLTHVGHYSSVIDTDFISTFISTVILKIFQKLPIRPANLP